MEDELNPGDKVMLKSGGPVMTFDEYEQVLDGKMATCSWFADGEKIQERFFTESIKRVEE
ncbi:DUF2158 domain-containing protein [Acidiphilium sp. AL]|uniref:DUF2158 domain-containing protein n=1 Tax=Acidiphilium iwatense TaxID=768198 RepID=A0ABS9E0Y6_9PROT|nr:MULTISPECIES: DUF2158 domain-containing protein [Acidiphilium]MCF3948613.1 DUF2158 domain-containing protein [Acidiphilium iwatense]MCU4162100.1 DUF2158 domain-containing protein [Acidiphilium sp. AL]